MHEKGLGGHLFESLKAQSPCGAGWVCVVVQQSVPCGAAGSPGTQAERRGAVERVRLPWVLERVRIHPGDGEERALA